MVLKLTIALGILMSAINAAASEELLELTCFETAQCKQFQDDIVSASCIEGRCRCSSPGGQTVKCKPLSFKQSNMIGGHCPCNVPFSKCNAEEDICYCEMDFVSSEDRRRCIPKFMELGTICELNSQCESSDSFAICDSRDRTCQCRMGFIKDDGICASIVASNTSCYNNTDCEKYGVHTKCTTEIVEHSCVCTEGYVSAVNTTNCLKIADYDANCSEHIQCQKILGPGGECCEGTCSCDAKHYVVETEMAEYEFKRRCERLVERGQYCLVNADCYQRQLLEREQTLDCRYGECECKSGYHSINNGICTKDHGMRLKENQVLVLLIAIVCLSLSN